MLPLTHVQAWRDQDDLESLCRDRPLVTPEIIGQNAIYGVDTVIKSYAGIPANDALRIALPHSLELTRHRRDTPYYRILARLPVIAYYAVDGVAHYRELGIRNLLWPMAAPFVYASRMVDGDRPDERRGTIFFPTHSTPTHRPEQDLTELGDRLLALPDRFHPVTVCMYYVDYWRGAHRPFAERGFRIVSAGHGLDPQFLFRLRHLLVAHEYAASNELSSSCYFAIHAGCRYLHVADAFSAARAGKHDDARAAAVRATLARISDGDPAEQRREAGHFLGADNLLEPGELRMLLRRAKQLDLWGACFDRGARPLPIAVLGHGARGGHRVGCSRACARRRFRRASPRWTNCPGRGHRQVAAGVGQANAGLAFMVVSYAL